MKSVLVPLAQGSEDLEAVTVLNILRRAGIEAVSASLDGHPIRGSRGTVLIPDTSLDEALKRRFDMVVLPGGQAVTSLGIVRAKAVIRDGREIVSPEYEDCKRIAMERNIPLLDVMKILERELREGTAPT